MMQIYSDKVFSNSVETVVAFEPEDVKNALNQIETLRNKGLYIVGYMRYDLKKAAAGLPLVYFEAFESFEPFKQKTPDYKIGTIVTPNIFKEEYAKQIA